MWPNALGDYTNDARDARCGGIYSAARPRQWSVACQSVNGSVSETHFFRAARPFDDG
jgi:hypothetical protein